MLQVRKASDDEKACIDRSTIRIGMSEKHIGEVVQVIGPVLDIRFAHDELPALLNAIEIDIRRRKADSRGSAADWRRCRYDVLP